MKRHGTGASWVGSEARSIVALFIRSGASYRDYSWKENKLADERKCGQVPGQ